MTIPELFLEWRLTGVRSLVVEGPTDARFFKTWLEGKAQEHNLIVRCVDSLDVTADSLEKIGLNDGNRSRVIFVAKEAHRQDVDLRCIADRDCGHDLTCHQYPTLLWTDFPALESYAVESQTLDVANRMNFGEKLPPASELLPGLSFTLRELFCARVQQPHLTNPKIKAGLRGKSLEEFSLKDALGPADAWNADSWPRPDASGDPRHYAYGHDIAAILLTAFANQLKNSAGLSTTEAIEGALRGAMLIVGTFEKESLFQEVLTWAT